MENIKDIPYPVKEFIRENNPEIVDEILPYNVKKEQVLTESEFEQYKKDNSIMIEDVMLNGDYHGYKYFTICFKNDTADEAFIKIV